jgi:hypothetical protein
VPQLLANEQLVDCHRQRSYNNLGQIDPKERIQDLFLKVNLVEAVP